MPEQTQGIDPATAEPNPTPAAPDGQPPAEGGAASAPAAADPSAASTKEPDLKEQIGGIQKRIDELTRDRYEAKREAEYWRNLAEQARQPAPQPQQPQADKTIEDFNYDAGAYQTYVLEQASQRAVQAAEKKLREQADRDAQSRRRTEFQSREAKFAENVKDYHETVYSDRVPISQPMAEAIAESDEGPAIAYHLAKNPQKAAEIARLSPVAAAMELGAIRANLIAERAKAEAAKSKVSQAPPPPPKVEGADPGTSVKVDSPESDALSDEEWTRRRNLQEAKRRRAS